MGKICLFIALAAGLTGTATASSPLKPEDIALRIFMGQAYPSGNIYLRPLPFPGQDQSEDEYQQTFPWPSSVSFVPLVSTRAISGAAGTAKFQEKMRDEQKELDSGDFQLESAYIPSLEGMDDSHEGCTTRFYKPRNPAYKYIGEDFFRSVLFNCNPNEGIGVFKAQSTAKYSFPVLAFAGGLRLTGIEWPSGRRRPLTQKEANAIKAEKKRTGAEDNECTTEPAYIDTAVLLLTGKIEGTDMSIRISSYDNPGCGGHLASIFVLDVMSAGRLLKTFTLAQYRGGI